MENVHLVKSNDELANQIKKIMGSKKQKLY